MNFYNEFDPFAATWLQGLIDGEAIPSGRIDTRSICDVTADDVRGFTQCHFFAGIGGWPAALALAGWPVDRPVWTASCPCQPFSAAGKRQGQADERHLWPECFRLISACRPECILGEQVPGAVGFGWLDGVFADLEGAGYTCGVVVLGAHSVGAPHKRQRLFWVACAGEQPSERNAGGFLAEKAGINRPRSFDGRNDQRFADGCDVDGVAYAGRGNDGRKRCKKPTGRSFTGGPADGLVDTTSRITNGRELRLRAGSGNVDGAAGVEERAIDQLGDASQPGLAGRSGESGNDGPQQQTAERAGRNAWSDYRIIPCRDSKFRRISAQSGDEPLAARIPKDMGRGEPELASLVQSARANRTGRLKGYGNAIVPQTTAVFIKAVMEVVL